MRDYSYDRGYNNREAESDAYLRSRGFERNEYGHYDDPDKPWRTGAHIDSNGRIIMDM